MKKTIINFILISILFMLSAVIHLFSKGDENFIAVLIISLTILSNIFFMKKEFDLIFITLAAVGTLAVFSILSTPFTFILLTSFIAIVVGNLVAVIGTLTINSTTLIMANTITYTSCAVILIV